MNKDHTPTLLVTAFILDVLDDDNGIDADVYHSNITIIPESIQVAVKINNNRAYLPKEVAETLRAELYTA